MFETGAVLTGHGRGIGLWLTAHRGLSGAAFGSGQYPRRQQRHSVDQSRHRRWHYPLNTIREGQEQYEVIDSMLLNMPC